MTKEKIIVGWQEWVSLPELDLPTVKAKIDTGAKTSSLHAVNIEVLKEGRKWYARFDVHPVQKNSEIIKTCIAPLVDQRHVKSSSGHKEHRCVISTPLSLSGESWDIHITLTDRDSMGMRMLIGREAMKDRIIVDPSKSFCHGKMTVQKAMQHYVN